MTNKWNPDIPVYGVICRTGSAWTVRMKEEVHDNGTTVNGSSSGYGEFPYEKYPGIPVIDLSGESFDRCFECLHIWDNYKPHMGLHTLEQFIQKHVDAGFKVVKV